MSYNRDKILPDWRIIMDKEEYRKKIIEMVERIESKVILKKIYTVVKTHLEILKKKEQGD